MSIWGWGGNAEHCFLLYMYMYIRTKHSLDSHAPPPRSSGLSADPPVEAALLPDQLQHTKYGIVELHTSRVCMYMFSTTHIQTLHHHTKYGIVELHMSRVRTYMFSTTHIQTLHHHTKHGIVELHMSRVRTYMFSTTHIQTLHHHTKYGIAESLLTHRPNITTSHAVLAGCAHPPRS